MAPKAVEKPAEKKPATEKVPAEKKLPKDAVAADKKKRVETSKIYIFQVLKNVHPDIGTSREVMDTMNSFINDMFERLAQEASQLARYNQKSTIISCEIQTTIQLVLYGELAKARFH